MSALMSGTISQRMSSHELNFTPILDGVHKIITDGLEEFYNEHKFYQQFYEQIMKCPIVEAEIARRASGATYGSRALLSPPAENVEYARLKAENARLSEQVRKLERALWTEQSKRVVYEVANDVAAAVLSVKEEHALVAEDAVKSPMFVNGAVSKALPSGVAIETLMTFSPLSPERDDEKTTEDTEDDDGGDEESDSDSDEEESDSDEEEPAKPSTPPPPPAVEMPPEEEAEAEEESEEESSETEEEEYMEFMYKGRPYATDDIKTGKIYGYDEKGNVNVKEELGVLENGKAKFYPAKK